MTTVETEYCVPCGFLDRVALVTGDRGVLTVAADGETVWDRADDEYDAAEGISAAHQTQSGDVDDVARRVRGAL